ncbi:MAG: HAD family hydrolase [Magnetococcales bacterium]|nr:HAD family hydrolase [Magnetococcales bacterium]
MSLALFDLDDTLIAGDSDYLWGRFLVDHKVVEEAHYERENRRFYDDYLQGSLDIQAYLRFQLGYLAKHDMETLNRWHTAFMADKITPIMLPKGRALLEHHRQQGDTLMIITATNRFVTGPIAQAFGVDHILATELEVADNRFTGHPQGIPCFREGKVTRLQAWLQESDLSLAGSHFYSDSHNDLPLLEMVTHPIAVDPDDKLRKVAQERGWEIRSLR